MKETAKRNKRQEKKLKTGEYEVKNYSFGFDGVLPEAKKDWFYRFADAVGVVLDISESSNKTVLSFFNKLKAHKAVVFNHLARKVIEEDFGAVIDAKDI